MKHMISSKAKCPFYKHESKPTVYCEGITEQSTIHVAFCDNSSAKAHKDKYCRRSYKDCPVYKMLEGGQP